MLALKLLSVVLLFPTDASAGESFGTALKGIRLPCAKERVVFSRQCSPEETPCAMNHWWSGGTLPGYLTSRVKYYVDGETIASVDVPLGLGHGMAPWGSDDNGPWAAGTLFGRTGTNPNKPGQNTSSQGSGFFNTFLIPFGRSINVTVELDGPVGGAEIFWLILRGRTNAALTLPGGEPLPLNARLRSYEHRASSLVASDYLPVLNATSSQSGAVLTTTLAVRSSNFAFLEGCLRASSSSGEDTWTLSSGTEDYFLGTFYFDKGEYQNALAGVTSLCPQPDDGAPRNPSVGCQPEAGVVGFSAYRVHAGIDPLLFENGGFAVTWRNGEPGHGTPVTALDAASFALVYQW